MQVNKQHVLRLVSRTLVRPGGDWAAALAQAGPSKENLLAGLPAGPFVVAGGVASSPGVWDTMMKFSTRMMKTMPQVYGLKEQQLDKLSQSGAKTMQGTSSISAVLELGKENEPLFAGAIGVTRVDDAQAFLTRYEKQGKLYNEIVKDANSPVMRPTEIEKCEIGGTPGLQITSKAPPSVKEGPQAAFAEMFFGSGGKIVAWLVPADQHTVLMGWVNKDRLEQVLAAVKESKPDLAAHEDVAKSVALLPKNAVATAYLSPQGLIHFVQRVGAMLPGAPLKPGALPDFPKTPPVAFAVTTAPNEVRTHLAIPAEALRAIGPYAIQVKAARDASRSGGEQ
jgi:hypothetical protein